MPTRVVSSSIDINADSMTVWTVLTDLARYPEWRPNVVNYTGVVTPGSRLLLTLRGRRERLVTSRPEVITAEPGTELLMVVRVPWVLKSEDCCRLSPANGGTHVVERVIYGGPVAGLLPIGKAMTARLEERNRALKARAEAIYQEGR